MDPEKRAGILIQSIDAWLQEHEGSIGRIGFVVGTAVALIAGYLVLTVEHPPGLATSADWTAAAATTAAAWFTFYGAYSAAQSGEDHALTFVVLLFASLGAYFGPLACWPPETALPISIVAFLAVISGYSVLKPVVGKWLSARS